MAIAFVDSDISTNDNVTTVTGVSWPSHAAGTIALLIWAMLDTATPTLDAAFTQQANQVDQNLRAILGVRLPASMTGSESGTISMTALTTNRMSAALGIWSGVASIGTVVNVAEGGTAVSEHPASGSMSITPLQDGSRIVLVYSERSSTGNTAGTMVAPALSGTPATIRAERGTAGTGGTYVCVADIQLGAGTAGVAQVFSQWNANDVNLASNGEMWLVELRATTSGTAAATQADNTSTGTGQLGYTGTATPAQAAQVGAASGQLGYTGTVAVTQAAQTASAAGKLGYTGTAAATQASQAATASGVLGSTGTAAVAQEAQTAAASGTLGYAGSGAVTQVGDVAAATGAVGTAGITGSVAVTQAADTASASGRFRLPPTERPFFGIHPRPHFGITHRPFTGFTQRP